jgi:hypothetical protein
MVPNQSPVISASNKLRPWLQAGMAGLEIIAEA